MTAPHPHTVAPPARPPLSHGEPAETLRRVSQQIWALLSRLLSLTSHTLLTSVFVQSFAAYFLGGGGGVPKKTQKKPQS